LERRVRSSSASPPLIQETRKTAEGRQQYKGSSETPHQSSPRLLPSQFRPPIQRDDDGLSVNSLLWDGSRISPVFAYLTYPAPEDMVNPAYTQPYYSISSTSNRTRADTDRLLNTAHQGLSAVKIQEYHTYNDPTYTCSVRAVPHLPHRP
jgi:hypothetical protein